MIRVIRGPEPAKLSSIRSTQLTALRALGREPKSTDIDGYRVVAEDLWRLQHHKCCYCEARIQSVHNDVEHYRPKAEAIRSPGCTDTHGYWWLAFSWENLLFACPGCNRSHKKTLFPLSLGSRPLMPEDVPPGNEEPLLIDPSSAINPIEHIEFVYQSVRRASAVRHWWARPRGGSPLGIQTIDVCGLNRSELREIREDHYETVVLDHARAIEEALAAGERPRIQREFQRALNLLKPTNVHVGLTYDALSYLIPGQKLLATLGDSWPKPNQVAI